MIEYTLVRTKRKTIALYVRNGDVEVRVPLKMHKKDIDKFVSSKAKWIEDKLTQSNECSNKRKNFNLTYGDLIIYRGSQYPIVAKPGNRIGFDGECFYVPQDLPNEQIKSACIQIYRILAKRDLTNRTLEYTKKMRVIPSTIKINKAKTRWGSCSSKKSLNFSWRLIMAEDDVIDYVVVHELAHIKEMNHSAKFWSIVENVMPDYKVRQRKLKDLQKRLAVEDWSE